MPTVVGIFDSRAHAEEAVLGLVEAGFERFDVKLISDERELTEQSLADDEVECYTEGLRRGGTVVTVRCYTLGMGKAAEVMRKMGAVDVSAHGGEERSVRPFGEMTQKAGMWGMRAGETEKERAEDLDERERRAERMGEVDRVYGGGLKQKGDKQREKVEDRSPRSQDRIEKD